MNLSIPEIIILVMMSLSLLISANKHGQPETGTKSFWVTLIGQCITFGLMYWAGLFH